MAGNMRSITGWKYGWEISDPGRNYYGGERSAEYFERFEGCRFLFLPDSEHGYVLVG